MMKTQITKLLPVALMTLSATASAATTWGAWSNNTSLRGTQFRQAMQNAQQVQYNTMVNQFVSVATGQPVNVAGVPLVPITGTTQTGVPIYVTSQAVMNPNSGQMWNLNSVNSANLPAIVASGSPITTSDVILFQGPVTVSSFLGTTFTGQATSLPIGSTTVTFSHPAGTTDLLISLTGAVNQNVTIPLSVSPNGGQLYSGGGASGGTGLTGIPVGVNYAQFLLGSTVQPTTQDSLAGLRYADYGLMYIKPWPAVGTANGTMQGLIAAGGSMLTTVMPSMTSATYTGTAVAFAQDLTTSTMYSAQGFANLTANFTAGSISGSIHHLSAFIPPGANATSANNQPAGYFNNLNVAGTITGNGFTGTVTAVAQPVSFAPTSANIVNFGTGPVQGHFYGPAANEVAGVFQGGGLNSTGGQVYFAGAFGAKQ